MNNNINDALEGFQVTSRTDKTKEDYSSRAIQLIKRAKKELEIPNYEELDVRQFVVWLSEKKASIARTTWRQYKSSVVYYLEHHHDVQSAVEALEYLKEITSVGALTTTERTSSLKLKKVSFEDWKKLDDHLSQENKKWHEQLRMWLRASIITGLRPVEWRNALIVQHNGMNALKIQNAKNTNGRGHGPTRTLLLEDITEEDLRAIKGHLNNVRTFIGMDEYEYFYKGCAISLYKACRQCWPRRKKHITLYSTRHQFSSNAKSSGFSKIEVAAMMGHAVDITATVHYGRKIAGNESLGVSPIEEDVSRVRSIKSTDFKAIAKNFEGRKGRTTKT
jgi:hypothetical protein